MTALLKRACDLSTIHLRQQRYLWMQVSRMGYRTREPAELEFPIEQPTLIHKLIETHVHEMDYTRDCKVALYPQEFEESYEQGSQKLRLVKP